MLMCAEGHIPKVIHNRPGLATIKCVRCKRLTLREYATAKDYEKIKLDIKTLRKYYRDRNIY